MSDLFKVADMDGKGLGCRRTSRSPIWSILSQSRLVEGAQTNVVPIYGAALAGLVSADAAVKNNRKKFKKVQFSETVRIVWVENWIVPDAFRRRREKSNMKMKRTSIILKEGRMQGGRETQENEGEEKRSGDG